MDLNELGQPRDGVSLAEADQYPLVTAFLELQDQFSAPEEAAEKIAIALRSRLEAGNGAIRASDVVDFLTMALQVFWKLSDTEALVLYGNILATVQGV